MPVRLDIRLPMEGGRSRPTVAGPNPQCQPWFGFRDATGLMKLESEVIADPKGTAVNRPLVPSSLDPFREE